MSDRSSADEPLPHRDGPVLVSIVVPVFNEADSLEPFVAHLDAALSSDAAVTLQIVFVNDGSTDDTLARLTRMQAGDARLLVIDLSRNFGKEAALSAGLDLCSGDVTVPMDVDLQDPPEVIPDMLRQWRAGYDVVLARRMDRDADSWSKRTSATWFYRAHNRMSDIQLPENVGDFRLMDREVVQALGRLPESRRFMKGLLAWVGFRTTEVPFVRAPRSRGASKFNGWKLWNLALEGVTSFSTAPLRIWTYTGLVVSAAALAFAAFIVVRVLLHGVDVPGYASIMVAVALLGGIQLIGIGVLGEYLGRTYIEAKRRPVYVVRRVYGRPAPPR